MQLKRIFRGLFHAVGLEIYRIRPAPPAVQPPEAIQEQAPVLSESNDVIPDLFDQGLQRLMQARVDCPIALLGTRSELAAFTLWEATPIEWHWDPAVNLPADKRALICSVPRNGEHWRIIYELKQKYGARILALPEVLLPFTAIQLAQSKFDYRLDSLDAIAPFYLGDTWFGPIDRLNDLIPLKDKRVIEFGPFDGGQTAGLVHHGVGELVCIEARAENFIKTLIAKEVFGWSNVRLVLDDMHNADAIKYGRFDLAFCHGTYYHAIAPFVFLENLVSLSDNVFVGGYVLKDDDPCETLSHEGERYRVQSFTETNGFTSGVNNTSYYFHPADLSKFFANRGYQITPIDDEFGDPWATHRFYRFLAKRLA